MTTAHRTALALVLVAVATGFADAASLATLSNGTLTAKFDARGLVSLSDSATGSYGFTSDGFTITLDGKTVASRALSLPRRAATKDSVTYTWIADTYLIEVGYDLRPGWRFLSKQIRVTKGQPSFHAGEVRVWDLTVTDPITDTFTPKGARPNLGTADYGICLRQEATHRGLLVLAQNPFLTAARSGQDVTVSYNPDMDWKLADGPFVADRGLIGPYRATGRGLPARMIPEWNMGANDSAPGMDEAEIEAFTQMVRAFVLDKKARPSNVFVPWCLNDYQIDIGTPEGRTEYKRILDAGAALGAEHVIFAPTNSDLAKREDSMDDWMWENLLWAGLGQKIRRNEWNPKTSPIPASVQEMLDYAKSKNLKLLAYVYPVVPFSQDPTWLTSPANNPARKYASLGIRSFQDWLIDTLVSFHDRLGLGGYSFDHTFLNYPGTSRYAQWAGWRRVMEELRRRVPDIVIDGRQAYHMYGPWGWLAGSYPHPTFNDEQPESFIPFPDLHFDRVSADRERWTAYRYRNYEFAPSELVPGFITHQTSRGDDTGEMPEKKTDKGIMLLPFRERDWDYLGWRYSLLSSIAIAGWNNVLDMIPARDMAEYQAFSPADRQWFRRWIDWTAENKEVLRHTRTIMGQPAIGKTDGTAAIVGNRGFLFLFNPNGKKLPARFRLDETIGMTGDGRFVLKELYPQEGRLVGKPGAGFWSKGDEVSLLLDGGSAMVLALEPAPGTVTQPILFNVTGRAGLENGEAVLSDVKGEAGTETTALVVLPAGQTAKGLTVNGRPLKVDSAAPGVVHAALRFDGAPFSQYQPLVDVPSGFAGGTLSGRFTIPHRVFDQLAARRKAWPIPWTAEDFRTTWLAPERLLLFVQIAEPSDKWEARLTIDGRTVELKKAYTAVRVASRTFVGFYADLSLLTADTEHRFELQLPTLKPGQLQGVFFENVETEYTGTIR